MLRTSILVAFFGNYLIFFPHIFGYCRSNSQVSLYWEILSLVTLKMWGNKSGAGVDPHPLWIWWYLVYTLSSATLPLNVGIILLSPFSDVSLFYFACVCSYCLWTNQIRLTMSLTRPVSCVSDAFSSYRFSF